MKVDFLAERGREMFCELFGEGVLLEGFSSGDIVWVFKKIWRGVRLGLMDYFCLGALIGR